MSRAKVKFPCDTCGIVDLGASTTAGIHFKENPDHRNQEQQEMYEANQRLALRLAKKPNQKVKKPTQRPKKHNQNSWADPKSEKQDARDFLVQRIQRIFPNSETPLTVLDFLAVEGLINPNSMTHQLRGLYHHVTLVGLEAKRAVYEQMLTLYEEAGFFQIHRMSAERHFRETMAQYDVMWLDYCGGTTVYIIKSWGDMFEAKMLKAPGVLGITICEDKRSAKYNKDIITEVLRKAKTSGYELFECGGLPYNHKRANPMKLLVFRAQ